MGAGSSKKKKNKTISPLSPISATSLATQRADIKASSSSSSSAASSSSSSSLLLSEEEWEVVVRDAAAHQRRHSHFILSARSEAQVLQRTSPGGGRLGLLPTSVLLASVEYLAARDVLVFTSTCRSTMLWTSDSSSLHGIDVFWRRIYERATQDFASLVAAAPSAASAAKTATACCPKGRLLQASGPFSQISVHANCHVLLVDLDTTHTTNTQRLRDEWDVKLRDAIARHHADIQTRWLHLALWAFWLIFIMAILSYGWTIIWLPYHAMEWIGGCQATLLECRLPRKWNHDGYARQRDVYEFLSPDHPLAALEKLQHEGAICSRYVCDNCSRFLCSFILWFCGGIITWMVYLALLATMLSTARWVTSTIKQQVKDIEVAHHRLRDRAISDAETIMNKEKEILRTRLMRTRPAKRPMGPHCACWKQSNDNTASCIIT